MITPAGIGSLLVDQPVSGTDMVLFDPGYCAEQYAEMGVTRDPGMWLPNYPVIGEGGQLFNVYVVDNTVYSIEIDQPTLRTAEGIGIGSTFDELSTAYPLLTLGTEGHYSKSLVLATDAGEVVFEVMTADLGGHFQTGQLVKMRIFPPGLASTRTTAGTDDTYRYC
ncbi:MAG: hypothetical protein WED09_00970 [Homoserinimonas sp.]